jgi:hypothetical protein
VDVSGDDAICENIIANQDVQPTRLDLVFNVDTFVEAEESEISISFLNFRLIDLSMQVGVLKLELSVSTGVGSCYWRCDSRCHCARSCSDCDSANSRENFPVHQPP